MMHEISNENEERKRDKQLHRETRGPVSAFILPWTQLPQRPPSSLPSYSPMPRKSSLQLTLVWVVLLLLTNEGV